MKVGITISLHQNSIWASGVNQNAIYLALLLKEGGHDVTLILSDHTNTGSSSEIIEVCDTHKLKHENVNSSIKKYFNVIIDIGFWLSNNSVALFKAKNPKIKIVQYNCGNNFLLETEHILFDHIPNRYKDFENTSWGEQPVRADQIWIIPQMENTCKDWYKFVSKSKNATVVPFVWEPIATEIYCEQKGFGEFVKRPIKKIATMEANISVMKHFLPTLVTVEELLDRGIDIENVEFVVNYDLPEKQENYVHRVGRTGRGTKKGQAISFCSTEEIPLLEAILYSQIKNHRNRKHRRIQGTCWTTMIFPLTSYYQSWKAIQTRTLSCWSGWDPASLTGPSLTKPWRGG